MKGKIHKYPLLIREHHLDTFGHVNNATYLEILEEARWELITQNNYSLATVQKSGLGPVILEVNLKFQKELKLRSQIVIETQALGYKGKVGTVSQEIKNEAGEVCAAATFVVGFFDLKQRKLIEPTSEWKKAIGLEE